MVGGGRALEATRGAEAALELDDLRAALPPFASSCSPLRFLPCCCVAAIAVVDTIEAMRSIRLDGGTAGARESGTCERSACESGG